MSESRSPTAGETSPSVTRPPFGMASRALSTKLTNTCSICARSPRPHGPSGSSSDAAGLNRTSIRLPAKRDNNGSISRATTPNGTATGSTDCRRANANNCRVSSAARCAPLSHCATQSRSAGGRCNESCSKPVIAADSRQQIVELVRDDPRQTPDRVHLLRLPQAVLDLSAFGDVTRNNHNLQQSSRFRIAHRLGTALHPAIRAVVPPHPERCRLRRGAPFQLVPSQGERPAVVRMNALEQVPVATMLRSGTQTVEVDGEQ